MTRPPQDYAPWAAALPYLYKLERLLPCYTGKGLLAGIFLCGCAVSRRVFRCPRKQVNEAKPVLVPSAPGPACRLAALGGRRAAAQLPAPAPAGEQSISAQQPTAASTSAPSLLCRGVPVLSGRQQALAATELEALSRNSCPQHCRFWAGAAAVMPPAPPALRSCSSASGRMQPACQPRTRQRATSCSGAAAAAGWVGGVPEQRHLMHATFQ
jgi:hypothetical protein